MKLVSYTALSISIIAGCNRLPDREAVNTTSHTAGGSSVILERNPDSPDQNQGLRPGLLQAGSLEGGLQLTSSQAHLSISTVCDEPVYSLELTPDRDTDFFQVQMCPENGCNDEDKPTLFFTKATNDIPFLETNASQIFYRACSDRFRFSGILENLCQQEWSVIDVEENELEYSRLHKRLAEKLQLTQKLFRSCFALLSTAEAYLKLPAETQDRDDSLMATALNNLRVSGIGKCYALFDSESAGYLLARLLDADFSPDGSAESSDELKFGLFIKMFLSPLFTGGQNSGPAEGLRLAGNDPWVRFDKLSSDLDMITNIYTNYTSYSGYSGYSGKSGVMYPKKTTDPDILKLEDRLRKLKGLPEKMPSDAELWKRFNALKGIPDPPPTMRQLEARFQKLKGPTPTMSDLELRFQKLTGKPPYSFRTPTNRIRSGKTFTRSYSYTAGSTRKVSYPDLRYRPHRYRDSLRFTKTQQRKMIRAQKKIDFSHKMIKKYDLSNSFKKYPSLSKPPVSYRWKPMAYSSMTPQKIRAYDLEINRALSGGLGAGDKAAASGMSDLFSAKNLKYMMLTDEGALSERERLMRTVEGLALSILSLHDQLADINDLINTCSYK